MKNIFCGSCSKRINTAIARRVTNSCAIQYLINKNQRFQNRSKVCPKCYTDAYKKSKKNTSRNSEADSTSSRNPEGDDLYSTPDNKSCADLDAMHCTRNETNEPVIALYIKRTKKTHSNCIICNSTKNLKIIKLPARSRAFIDCNIFIPSGARCCECHLIDNVLSEESLKELKVLSPSTTMSKSELESFIGEIRKIALKPGLDFDFFSSLSEDDYYQLTGVSKMDFDIMANSIKTKIRSTSTRTYRQCLAILLVKLRTGLSHTILSVLFKIKRRTIGKCIHAATKALMSEFVPLHLGTEHISRKDFINKHTRDAAKRLFADGRDDVAILVVDGTYIFIEKSNNYLFQRRTYSMHKHRPLVKPMIFVSTTGYILEVLGPYYADRKNNDASILNSAMTSAASNIRNWLAKDDVLVVDRGFRDSVELLEELGFIAKMPHFLQKKNQHPTEEANESRLITSIRWVIEAINGLLKRWKSLGQVMPNSQIPLIGDFVRIVCAMINAFRVSRIENSDEDMIIADRMLNLVKQPNQLKLLIDSKNWIKRHVVWQKMESRTLKDFPRLTINELRNLTLGIYQIKQGKSYTEEHVSDSGLYELFVHKERNDIIRVQLKSRHMSSKIYNTWIQYSNSTPPISSWYCQCKVGARTVGCCAHVAAVLWYLGYKRHIEEEKHKIDYNEYIADATTSNWSESDETDEDESI